MPLRGITRDERGYTGAENSQAENDHLIYGREREAQAVSGWLFEPQIVARQRKHVEGAPTFFPAESTLSGGEYIQKV